MIQVPVAQFKTSDNSIPHNDSSHHNSKLNLLLMKSDVVYLDVNREKSGLSDEIKVKQELIQQRKGELEVLQGDVSQASQQKEELEKKREDMRKIVNQMNDEVS